MVNQFSTTQLEQLGGLLDARDKQLWVFLDTKLDSLDTKLDALKATVDANGQTLTRVDKQVRRVVRVKPPKDARGHPRTREVTQGRARSPKDA